ncbi:hypothetical protein [Helicobacter sp. T3_23-1059]
MRKYKNLSLQDESNYKSVILSERSERRIQNTRIYTLMSCVLDSSPFCKRLRMTKGIDCHDLLLQVSQ